MMLRLWLLLSAAFVIAATGGGMAMLTTAVSRTVEESRAETARTARLLAWVAEQENAHGHKVLYEKLQGAVPGVRRVQVIPPELGVKAAWNPEIAQIAMRSRREAVADDYTDLGAGPSLVAYAPVGYADGRVGLVGVEVDETSSTEAISEVYALAAVGLLVACLIGLAFSYSLTRHLVGSTRHRRLRGMLKSPRYLKSLSLELILGGIAATVLLGGGISVRSALDLYGQRERLTEADARLDSLVQRAHEVEVSGIPVVAKDLGVNREIRDREALIHAISEERSELKLREAQIQRALRSDWVAVAFTFGFAAVLIFCSLVLSRVSFERENELEVAQLDAARSEAAKQQIVDNLPLGFYTYTPGHIGYANDAWKSLFRQGDDADAYEAFVSSLHPDEKEVVLAALGDAIATGSGFGFGHRILSATGEVRHVESRGVPIHDETGSLEHVVGFTLDVTARVKTRQLLEAKTQEVEATNARLRQALSDLEDNFEAMVLALVKAVEAKDPYTAGHSERVMQYAVRIGESLGLSPYELRVLHMGSLIHDIGKIGVPDFILTKPSELSAEEYETVKSHAITGARMVEGIPMFRDCVPIVLLHHERLDGSGYPYGLQGANVPLLVRIVTVADCYDAMTSTRAYRAGLSSLEAITRLRESAARGVLDIEIVEAHARTITQMGQLLYPASDQAA